MRKTALLLFGIVSFSCAILNAQSRNIGAGIILGEPTGFVAEYKLENSYALRFAAAYSILTENNKFSLHIDYIGRISQISESSTEFPLYYGVGIRWRFRQGFYSSIGVRGIGGLEWPLSQYPVNLFLEIAPVFELFPKTNLTLDSAVGFIYFF